MSTHAWIGKLLPDDTVEFVECYMDGHLRHVGIILREFWSDPALIDAMLKEGRISSLGTELGEKHDGTIWPPVKGHENYTVFSFRDRQQDAEDTRASTKSLAEYLGPGDIPYRYLFKDGQWYVTQYDRQMKDEPPLLTIDEAICNVPVTLLLDRREPGVNDVWVNFEEESSKSNLLFGDVSTFLNQNAESEWQWVVTKYQPMPVVRCSRDAAAVAMKLRFEMDDVPTDLFDPLLA
jgi:hypothetical protein